MRNKFKLWIVLSLVLAFAAGVVAGFYAERYGFQKKMRDRGPRPGHFPSIERMAEDLDLTAEQQSLIKDIFQKNEERFKELNGDIRQRLQAIRERLKTEIDSVLTPEQKKKMEDMIEQYRSRGRRDPGNKYPNKNDREREKGVKR